MTDYAPFRHYITAKLDLVIANETNRSAFGPSITLSRQAGARAVSIGEKLVEHLKCRSSYLDSNWTLFDQNLVKTIIEDNHLPPDVEPQMLEDHVHLMTDVISEVFKTKLSDWTLFDHSVHTIRKLCQMGHAVVVGRGGNFMTQDLANTFSVRLVGSFEQRLKHVQKKFGMTEKAAESYINDKDAGRRRYVKSHLHQNIDDPTVYDMVLNTDDLSDDSVVAIITQALEEWARESVKNVGAGNVDLK